MTLIHFIVPGNAQILLGIIFSWIKFDFYDTESLTARWYSPAEGDVDDGLAQLGYESMNCLPNLGSLFYILILQILCTILYTLCYWILNCKCWKKKNEKVKQRVDKKRIWFKKKLSGVFWNSTLAVIDGTNLVFLYTAAINIKN